MSDSNERPEKRLALPLELPILDLKKERKFGRKHTNSYKTISYEISHLKPPRQKIESGNMSPRGDQKGRKALNTIVKIELYNETNNDAEFDEHFKMIDNKTKTPEDYKKLAVTLRRHFIFYSLEDQQLNSIIDKMIYCFSAEGTEIIPQGSMANFFFVLDEGTVDILINGEVKRQLVEGQFFGDLALLYNSPRSATVKAATDVKMWGIAREAFKNQVRHLKLKQYQENRAVLNKVALFSRQLTNLRQANEHPEGRVSG